MSTAGEIYIYSIHAGLALNITCHPDHHGAVLIRAMEPEEGIPDMIRRRKRKKSKISQTWNSAEFRSLRTLTNGPSKLAEALGIKKEWNRSVIGKYIVLLNRDTQPEITQSTRIGISASVDLPWRFCDRMSEFLSRPDAVKQLRKRNATR